MSLRGLLLGLVLVAGCSTGAARRAPAEPLVPPVIDGRWESRPEPGVSRTDMTLDLWLAGERQLQGRLVGWVSGDLPLDPRKFGAITGEIAGPLVTLHLPQPGSAGILTLEARQSGDTLVLERSRIGVDEGPLTRGLRFIRTGSPQKS